MPLDFGFGFGGFDYSMMIPLFFIFNTCPGGP